MAEDDNGTNGGLTRREAREAFQARTGASFVRRREPAKTPALEASAAAPVKRKRPLKSFANVFVLVAAAGIIGTVAIPAYAFNPSSQGHSDTSSAAIYTMKKANAQSADVAATATAPAATHEGFDATTVADIQSARQAAANAAAAKAAAAKAAAYAAAYTGPTAAQYVAQTQATATTKPVLGSVLATAEQYAGTPYVYGGSTPAGFDCSGFVMFVYAQFGISLPHSSSAQGHIGQTVSLAQAQPGDVIALNDGSHVGFYAGTDAAGQVLIYDAPKPGGVVGERPIWTSAYHIQHYGG